MATESQTELQGINTVHCHQLSVNLGYGFQLYEQLVDLNVKNDPKFKVQEHIDDQKQ